MKLKKALLKGIALFCITLCSNSSLIQAAENPFVADNFEIPRTLENEYFRIKPLTQEVAEQDYKAVVSSMKHLQEMFLVPWEWPQSDITLEDNYTDLGEIQARFINRTSFAYTVLSLDEREVLGAVYFNPANKGGYDADITMWVSQSAKDKGLDSVLFDTVKAWAAKDWPFKNPGYPGREISWADWEALK